MEKENKLNDFDWTNDSGYSDVFDNHERELHNIQVMLEKLVCYDNKDLKEIQDGVMVVIREIINIKNKIL